MEILNIIVGVLFGCAVGLSLVIIIVLIIKHCKLAKAKSADDVIKALSYGTKLCNISVVFFMMVMGVLMLYITLTCHPQMCAMRVSGFVLASVWFLMALGYLFVFIKKKKRNKR